MRVALGNIGDLDTSFGALGLKVGPRSGPNKRSNSDKEWYILRRFLKEAVAAGVLRCPINIRQGNPPHEPDFVLQHEKDEIHLEITEATHDSDQREMALIERSDKPAILIGELGGRYKGGASNTGPDWAQDIVAAIVRKIPKVIFRSNRCIRHLVIYPNSNASALLFDEDDECGAAQCLESLVNERKDLAMAVNGCQVHVLAKNIVIFDATKRFLIVKRLLSHP